MSGVLYLISGPSGAGKTSLTEGVLKRHPKVFSRIRTVTTRPIRISEDPGAYEFITPDDFTGRVLRGELLEFAEVYGHMYGTPAEAVEEYLGQSKNVLLVLDCQGVRATRLIAESRGIPVQTVFIAAPSVQELQSRLLKRGDDPLVITQRMNDLAFQCHDYASYDHFVMNDRFDAALTQMEIHLVTASLNRKNQEMVTAAMKEILNPTDTEAI